MKILLAIDDSPYSKEVVDTIVRRHWPKNTQFKLLNVIEPTCLSCNNFNESEAATPEALSNISEMRHHAAQHLCDKVRHRIESKVPDAIVYSEIREGLPHTEIVNVAVEWEADTIVIGAHGRDVCPHDLFGSVSLSVASHAPCSVEIVRSKSYHRVLQDAACRRLG